MQDDELCEICGRSPCNTDRHDCPSCGRQNKHCECDPRENAVHLVRPLASAWTEVTRSVCGFRGARFTTTRVHEATCDECKGGA